MISDQIIKKEFVSKTLTSGANKIFSLQSKIVEETLSEKTGRLFSNLRNKNFLVLSEDNGKAFSISASIVNYLRFNEIRDDMPLRGKLHLYNRIVWGVLYGETLPTLKFGLTDEIRDSIRQQIKESGIQLQLKFE